MRMAMVEIIGFLIKYLASADNVEKRERKINSYVFFLHVETTAGSFLKLSDADSSSQIVRDAC